MSAATPTVLTDQQIATIIAENTYDLLGGGDTHDALGIIKDTLAAIDQYAGQGEPVALSDDQIEYAARDYARRLHHASERPLGRDSYLLGMKAARAALAATQPAASGTGQDATPECSRNYLCPWGEEDPRTGRSTCSKCGAESHGSCQ